ncbi:hypothetical protein [Deinococcus frigens]|uniref:hypothetical protein n=1 Tax=Deinococcus frigens TaxID=249403 RepID=UPI0004953A14|nr:hypothetical protein [Deinococcus frigens]
MRAFNSLVAHFGDTAISGQVEALEGGRGLMRVSLNILDRHLAVDEGSECVLELHDGARFRVVMTERLSGAGEWRVRLLAEI